MNPFRSAAAAARNWGERANWYIHIHTPALGAQEGEIDSHSCVWCAGLFPNVWTRYRLRTFMMIKLCSLSHYTSWVLRIPKAINSIRCILHTHTHTHTHAHTPHTHTIHILRDRKETGGSGLGERASTEIDVGIIRGKKYDELALEAWTLSEVVAS